MKYLLFIFTLTSCYSQSILDSVACCEHEYSYPNIVKTIQLVKGENNQSLEYEMFKQYDFPCNSIVQMLVGDKSYIKHYCCEKEERVWRVLNSMDLESFVFKEYYIIKEKRIYKWIKDGEYGRFMKLNWKPSSRVMITQEGTYLKTYE